MARRTLIARADATVRIEPSWDVAPVTPEMGGKMLRPDSDARIAPTTFDAWLAAGYLAPQ
jgi:hypothetical protein